MLKKLRGIKRIIICLSLAYTVAGAIGFAIPNEEVVAPAPQPLHVLAGKSVIINTQTRLKRVLVSNPTIIEALTTSPTQVVVDAKTAGASSLILWDETGFSRMFDVTVDLDLSGLRSAIRQAYPETTLHARADGGRIILSGTVPDQRIADESLKMASVYSKDVVLSLNVSPPRQRQIMLEVKFAEVDRTRLDQLGFNILSTGAANTPGMISTQQFGAPTPGTGGQGKVSGTIGSALRGTETSFGLTDLLNVFLFRPDINLGATVKALEQKNVLQILAQPNLLAINGQKASFLAGGEFPFPVVQGGQNIGVVTIQFRPFGVRLDFVGDIQEGNVVRLHVAPEVSTLDYTNAVTISGFTVPAISTRRAETEIDLRDGQSFGIAGLLDQRVQAQLARIPGIGSVPILGKLFQSKFHQQSRSELLVLVTPHIVDPVQSGEQTTSLPQPAFPPLNNSKFDHNLPGHKELEKAAQPPAQTKGENDGRTNK